MGAEESRLLDESLGTLFAVHVEETSEVLGRGPSGVMIVAEMNGLPCACKKLHPISSHMSQLKVKGTVSKFVEECKRLSQLRHPNIVQFLGVCFDHSPIPSLVMELLPTSLGAFLEEYDNVPSYIKHSVLLDVAVALCYLHSQSPPIIHRDLTVSNVLLTQGLKAKISNPGVTNVLSYTTSKSRLSIAPSFHTPPELYQGEAANTTKFDVFSYGHMTIHVLLQREPIPRRELGHTEIANRQKYITEIGSSALQQITIQCLKDNPRHRPNMEVIIKRVKAINSGSALQFSTIAKMLCRNSKEETGCEVEHTTTARDAAPHQWGGGGSKPEGLRVGSHGGGGTFKEMDIKWKTQLEPRTKRGTVKKSSTLLPEKAESTSVSYENMHSWMLPPAAEDKYVDMQSVTLSHSQPLCDTTPQERSEERAHVYDNVKIDDKFKRMAPSTKLGSEVKSDNRLISAHYQRMMVESPHIRSRTQTTSIQQSTRTGQQQSLYKSHVRDVDETQALSQSNHPAVHQGLSIDASQRKRQTLAKKKPLPPPPPPLRQGRRSA